MADRLAQLLGVLSLSATDRFRAAVETSLGRGGAHAGALVHLDAHPGGSVQSLADVLAVSQPAAVKLVERLVADGLVERGPGPDRRTSALAATAAGREAARRVLAERASELEGLLGVLDAGERDRLRPLLEKLVAGLAGDRSGALTACRLCDRGSCWGERGTDCPLQHTVS